MKKYNCCHLASRFVAMLALVFLGTASSLATPISESEALQRAIAFMQQRGKTIDLPSNVRRAPTQGTGNTAEAYYVFNLQDEGGFVVVSGDDRTPAILGYADSGSFNVDDIPDGLRYLLGQYADEMAWLDAHPEYAEHDVAASRAASVRQPVAPLLQSRWDQVAPYNNLCPEVDNERTVTGCVATSIAQVMYYYKWPQQQTATIPGYTTRDLEIPMKELDPIYFDWDKMTDTYDNSASSESGNAVAQLMLYCGQAVHMNYNVASTGGSSANSGTPVGMLKAYFGYDADFVQRKHYTYQQWVDLIYDEVVETRPVVFSGQSVGGGHSFVCDGYDSGDYFHINWGWSGAGNGYFRLSAFNPYEQGVGGSSTLDGFSYSQDAVIGIVPRDAGSISPKRITLETLQLNSSGSITTKTYNRKNDAFTGINLYYTVCSYLFEETIFDVSVQLFDSNGGFVAYLSQTNTEMAYNTNYSTTYSTTDNNALSIPADLVDGSYYIKVMCRQNDTNEEWQDCYDGPQLQIEAIVSGNKLTLNAPFVNGSGSRPRSATLNVSEQNPKVGYELEVIASVTGYKSDYHGNLFLYVDGKRKMGKTVDIPAGKTVDVRFVYTPDEAGEDVITIRRGTGESTIIGNMTIAIAASDAISDIELEYTAHDITNQNVSGQLYGNAFRATVTVSNTSTNSYAGWLNCSVREWTQTLNGDNTIKWTWKSISSKKYTLIVDKNGTTTVDLAADGLQPGKLYSARITYLRQGANNNTADLVHLGYEDDHGILAVADNSYSLGDANGTITPCYIANGSINAGDACYADLRYISSFNDLSITPSTNTNCLYLLADGADVPSDLTNKNVVKGNTATTIALVDEHPFYSPITFTASSISYTRTFTLAAAGKKGGWNTIMLPFAPSSIKVGEDEKGWFQSDSDTDKHFWLRTFTGDLSGHVYFGYPTAMEAYVPYLIAVPGDTWGETWKLTDKEMVFSGTNASIVATKDVGTPASGDYFMFCGSTAGTTANEAIYMLNDAGSKFVKKPAGTAVAPFRGWFEAISISSLGLASLSIGSAATDINLPQMNMLPQQQQVYDLQGRSVQGHMKPGIYIMGGKKVIIK